MMKLRALVIAFEVITALLILISVGLKLYARMKK
jgi:hypothetical protein